MEKILQCIQMMCGNSFLKWFKFGVLSIGIPLAIISFPIIRLIEWKRDCKKYGKETAYEIWRRM